MLAFAALDVLVGARAVLVELLVAGPLIASTRLPPLMTALVAAAAVALAIPLGVASDAFGAPEHLIGVIAVAIGAVLAVAISALRSARERDAAHLQAQYRTARVLAQADSLEAAGEDLLEAIGQPLGWRFGQLWAAAGDHELRCVASWAAAGVESAELERVSRRTPMRRGSGLPGRALERGEAIWLFDAATDPGYIRKEALAPAGLHGAMAFPVGSGGRCVAVIELYAFETRERDPDVLELTSALSAQIGEFVERRLAARAVRDSQERKGAVLASALDGVITVDHRGHVLEWNPAAERIFGRNEEEALGKEMGALIVPPSLRERHRRALARHVETGEATILGSRLELTGMRADGSEFPVELAVNRIEGQEPPMFVGTVRDITARRHAAEEREELLRLEQLARLDADEARDQLEAILRGVADAITAQAPDGRLLFANDAAVRMLGFESSEALTSAPLQEILGRYEILTESGDPFPLENLPGRRALVDGEPGEVVVRFRMRATAEERWSAVKATPIRDPRGRVTMAINVIEDITRHKRAELAQRFLADSSAVLSESLDPDELLRRVAGLAVPDVADWCAVDLRDELGHISRVALAHSDPEMLAWGEELGRRYPPNPHGQEGVAGVLRTGVSALLPEITDEMLRAGTVDEEHYRLISELGMRSAMIVPMRARGRVVGALSFVTGRSGRRFDETDLELVEELARRCATAVDNARLFTERAYIARTLQQSLLPVELPVIPGIDAAARYRATGDGNDVGGDFYDLFPTGGRGWTVVMGDVCGKGPDAAAVTALARYTLRAAAMRERLPSRSLKVLNEALLRQRDDRRFCTVAYAYLETLDVGARVGLACGGHPLPLLLHADGRVEPVGEAGTLIGVVPDPDLEDRAIALEPGDSLVFYTDGVIEGRGAGEPFDEVRLAQLVASCAGRDADAIASAVERAAVDAQAGRPRDDIAVLVLRVAP